ncbi:MAG TPA: pyrroline-5-carboxylate reductase [Chloroflexia bacterium]|nr:pyrroline-5-carboxylate reductase [Chloroflexia bacterium]
MNLHELEEQATHEQEARTVLHGQRLAFIGGGVMAEVMMSGVLERHLTEPGLIKVSHPRPKRAEELASRLGVNVTTSNSEAARDADIVILCVKPQRLNPVLNELAGQIKPHQLLISIITGTTTETLASRLDHPAVVRVMPNTPAQIGHGMSVWTTTPAVTSHQREQVKTLLGALGKEMWFEEERYIDMATAVSGTGPAYVFLFMEALIDAAVHLGFSRNDARELVTETVLGSVLLTRESPRHPAELRNMVTSPNGTTAEALYELEKGSLRTILSKAVHAAYQKTSVLSSMTDKK